MYRVSFFEGMHKIFPEQFELYYSSGGLSSISKNIKNEWAKPLPSKLNILNFIFWQRGVGKISLRKGDVLILTANPRFLSNLLLIVRAWLAGVKIVWWGHLRSSTSSILGTQIRMLILRLGIGAIFYTDKEVSDFFERHCFFDKEFVIGLNNSVDDKNISQFRKPYFPEQREDRILFIGRLTKKANLHILINALSQLNNNKIKLDIIGDGPELSSLMRLAKRGNILGQITWHSSIIDEDAISDIANKAKICVYPGAVGLSLNHAMAYGLPTIIHDQPSRHMPEAAAFINGVTGCSFAMNDVDDLAEKILTMINSDQNLSTMSQKSLDEIANNFNLEKMVARTSAFLNRILSVAH